MEDKKLITHATCFNKSKVKSKTKAMAIKQRLNGTVHSRERKRLHSNLVVHLSLYLELEIRHASYDFLHFRKKQQR